MVYFSYFEDELGLAINIYMHRIDVSFMSTMRLPVKIHKVRPD